MPALGTATHGQRNHAWLSASGSSIWLNCSMSPILSETLERRSSVYADEGTKAHELSEFCLHNPGAGIPAGFTESMAGYVFLYVNHCRTLMARTPIHQIEKRVDLSPLWDGNPPTIMFGTADFVAVTPDKVLHVVDLKYGRGVGVEVEGSTQLRYYALGSYLAMRGAVEIERVRMTIVQPRFEHPDGYVRSWEIPVLELLQWGYDVLQPAVDTICARDLSELELVEGTHCRWCPAASAGCPEKSKTRATKAAAEFDDCEE